MDKEMKALGMPGVMVAAMSHEEPSYPSVTTRTKEDLQLPEGDFFFLAIGRVKRREEVEEDDGTMCYYNTIEMHALMPVSSLDDEKKLTKPDGSLEDDFDKAADKMLSLKDEDSGEAPDEDDNEDDDDEEEY